MSTRRALAAFLPAVLTVAFLVWPSWAVGPVGLISLYNLVGVVSVAVLCVAVRVTGADRTWVAITVSQALWVAGDIVYQLQDGASQVTLADPIYLAGYGALAVGILGMLRDRLRERDLDSAIDAGIWAAVASIAMWEMAVRPALADATVPLSARLIAAVYPVLDVVLLTAALRVVLAPSRRPVAVAFVCASVTSTFLADLGYGILEQTGAYQTTTTTFLDGLWLAGYALFPMGLLLGRGGRVARIEQPRHHATRLLPAAVGILALPAMEATSRLGGAPGLHIDVVVFAGAVIAPLSIWRVVRLVGSVEQARAEIAGREAYYEAVATSSSDAYILIGDDGTVIAASPAIEEVVGYTRDEAIGVDPLRLVHRDHVHHARALFEDARRAPGSPVRAELLLDGQRTQAWVEARCTSLVHRPEVGALVVNIHDITDRKVSQQELEHQALHDALTGLANRALVERRTAEIEGARRALVMLDLDGFKQINDALGHAAGDQVLRTSAARLAAFATESDTAARVGGDEFALLIHDPPREDLLVARVVRLVEALAEPVDLGGREVVLTASAGIAIVDPDEATVDMTRRADVALYAAKADGKAGVRLFDAGMLAEAADRLQLETELRTAVESGAVEIHYQPTVSLATGGITGVEALARWRHPERGMLPPSTFIPLAERTGLIVPLGRAVLHQACQQAAAWQEELGIPDLHVNVNVSPRQMKEPGLVDDVRHALDAASLSPSSLVIEVTETLLADHDAVERIESIRALGVRVAIDDFGTGYSSLSYLRRLPVDVLKIDRSFLDHVDTKVEQAVLVRAVIGLASALGLETVAEGVERAEQLRVLDEAGCGAVQGYFLARPQPASVVGATVLGWRSPFADPKPTAGPAQVRLELGPQPSAAALAWFRHADHVLHLVEAGRVPGVTITKTVLTVMRAFVDQWTVAAMASETFHWTSLEDRELVQVLMRSWAPLARALEPLVASGELAMTAEAAAVSGSLVDAILVALSGDEASQAEAVALQRSWRHHAV